MEIRIVKPWKSRYSDYLFPSFIYSVDNKNKYTSKFFHIDKKLLRLTSPSILNIQKVFTQSLIEVSLLLLLAGTLPIFFSITLNAARLFTIWSFTMLARAALLSVEEALTPKTTALSISAILKSILPQELLAGTFTHECGHALAYRLLYGNSPKQMTYDHRMHLLSFSVATTEGHFFQMMRRQLPGPLSSLKGSFAKWFKITAKGSDKIFIYAGPLLNIFHSLALLAIASQCENKYIRTFFTFRACAIATNEYIYACSAIRFDPKKHLPVTDYQNLVKLGMNRFLIAVPALTSFLLTQLSFLILPTRKAQQTASST